MLSHLRARAGPQGPGAWAATAPEPRGRRRCRGGSSAEVGRPPVRAVALELEGAHLVLAAFLALDLDGRGVPVDRDVLDVEREVVGVLDRLVELLLAARAGLRDLVADRLREHVRADLLGVAGLARGLQLLDLVGDLLLLALEVAGGRRAAGAAGGQRGEHERKGEEGTAHTAPRG